MSVEALQKIIDESTAIAFFGGAGVSTESGIPDFRSQDGLYSQKWRYPPEEILSHSFFMRNTGEFYRFYREKMICLEAKPNAAHLKLAELEAAGRLTGVVTQNIDGLHQAAGSRKVFELHGSVLRNNCMDCGAFYDVGFNTDSDQHSEMTEKVFASTGLEVRWRSPMGDLRFAYGYPLSKFSNGEKPSSGRFEFSMGQPF